MMICKLKSWLSFILLCSLMVVTPWLSANTITAITPMTSANIVNPGTNQQQNFIQALSKVLIKVSGNPTVMTLPTIRANFAHVTAMVDSYSTHNNPKDPNQTILTVNFNPKAIAHLLTLAGQPMWDAKRPMTLIWLTMQNADGSYHVIDATEAQAQPLALAIKADAADRGLTVIFPLLDLADQSFVPTKNGNPLLTTANMQTLANRYHINSVLAGVITPVNQQWQAQWRYLLDSAPITWQQGLSTTQVIAQQAINTVSSTMIAQLAISTTSNINTNAYLVINQVTDLKTYATLNQCLSHLNHMTKLSPVDLNQNQVIFSANYNGTTTDLINNASKTCQLLAEPTSNIQNQLSLLPNKTNTQTAMYTFNYVGH